MASKTLSTALKIGVAVAGTTVRLAGQFAASRGVTPERVMTSISERGSAVANEFRKFLGEVNDSSARAVLGSLDAYYSALGGVSPSKAARAQHAFLETLEEEYLRNPYVVATAADAAARAARAQARPATCASRGGVHTRAPYAQLNYQPDVPPDIPDISIH